MGTTERKREWSDSRPNHRYPIRNRQRNLVGGSDYEKKKIKQIGKWWKKLADRFKS